MDAALAMSHPVFTGLSDTIDTLFRHIPLYPYTNDQSEL